MNREIVVWGVTPMRDVMSSQFTAKRFAMTVLGMFAALATLLACVGIYGVVSYTAGRRTQEIGIRMAMGAERGDILRMVLAEAAKMALVGVAIGLVASLLLTRLMGRMLFGVSARDPLTFLAVAVLLTCVALSACLVPATRVDPVVALRYE